MAGLSSLSKNINIKGQPHSLAYINKAEAALLKARGGSGKPTKETNGIPSYYDAEGWGGPDYGGPGGPEGSSVGSGGVAGSGAAEGDVGDWGSMTGGQDLADAAAAADAADKGALQDFYAMTPETISLMEPQEQYYDEFLNIKEEKKSKFLPKPDASALGQDYVLQAAITNPEYKKMYDDAIRGAAKSMTSNEIHGVMGQDGYRDGRGYISHLERGGFDRTHGLGIRGQNEVQGPEGMTKDQYDNYVDLYMAFDETRAGNLRMELDAVKRDSPKTVGSIFGKSGVNPSIYGLDKDMNANKVAEYMDMKALEGIIQGIPMFASIVTGNVSPMMTGSILAPNAFREVINDVKSWFSGTALEPTVEEVDALGVELKENVMSVVPENIDIAARIGELFGVRNQDYFDKEGFYNRPEPTVKSLMTEEDNAKFNEAGSVMSAYEAFLEPPAVPDPVGPPLDLTVGLRGSPSAVPAVSEADRAVERADLPMSDAKLAELMAMIDNPSIAPPDTLTATDRAVESTRLAGSSNNVVNTETLNYIVDSLQRRGTPASDIQKVVNARSEKELTEVLNRLDKIEQDRYQAGRVKTNRRSEEVEKARVGVN